MTKDRVGFVCPLFPDKVTFTSERQAKRAIRAIKHPLGSPRPYRCGAHWHLGKGSQRKEPGGRFR